MSKASRYKALAPVRIREQEARELWDLDATILWTSPTSGPVPEQPHMCLAEGHATFNVHAAREHAHKLVALEAEHDAFADWTREQGLGPENREHGAFDESACLSCCNARGKLASVHYARCEVCLFPRGGWPGKLAAQWARPRDKGGQGGDRRAPMGRSLARLGRRILAALEGQPSECQGERCIRGIVPDVDEHGRELCGGDPCPDCQGTGHNLHGELPPVKWSPQVRRKVSDSRAMGRRNDVWTGNLAIPGTGKCTRSVPRGEHRAGDPGSWDEHYRARCKWTSLDRLMRPDLPKGQHVMDRLPRWRRGELRHAEQRRARETRAYNLEMSEHALTLADVL